MLDPAAAYVNVTGVFPDTVGVNASGPSATDGFEFIANFVNDNNLGQAQMILNHAGLTPNGVPESDAASQIKEALWKGFGAPPGIETEWNLAADPGTTGHRCVFLNGQGVLRASYPLLDVACYVGDGNNAAAASGGGFWYHADNADGSSPNIAGVWLILPESRGLAKRGLDTAATIDPDGASRFLGDVQIDAFQGHTFADDLDADKVLAEQTRDFQATVGGGNTDRTISSLSKDATDHPAVIVTDGVNGTPRTATETRMYNRSTKSVVWY